MTGLILAAVQVVMILLSNIEAYKAGQASGELKQIRRERRVIKDIDPMNPDARGMLEAMSKLQRLREEDDKR